MVKIFKFGITGLIIVGTMASNAAVSQTLPPVDKMIAERSLGNNEAKVTVIEYASLTCPHCADFHTGPWLKIKQEYVETGKIKFIFRLN